MDADGEFDYDILRGGMELECAICGGPYAGCGWCRTAPVCPRAHYRQQDGFQALDHWRKVYRARIGAWWSTVDLSRVDAAATCAARARFRFAARARFWWRRAYLRIRCVVVIVRMLKDIRWRRCACSPTFVAAD